MKAMPLPSDDPFFEYGKWIESKWKIPQRPKESQGKITMIDLGQMFLGERAVLIKDSLEHEEDVIRTDFYKYATGAGAGIKQSTIDAVDRALPGTRFIYEIGPRKVPLWAALVGNITVKDFWLPLARSGQANDLLELLSGSIDWEKSGASDPPPNLVITETGKITGMSLNDALKYEAENFLPNLSLKSLVIGIMKQLSEGYFRQQVEFKQPLEEPFDFNCVDVRRANFGVLALSIAVSKLAIVDPRDLLLPEKDWHNPNEPQSYLSHLRNILIGLMPFVKKYDATVGQNGDPIVKLEKIVGDLISKL